MYIIEYCKIGEENKKELWVFSFMKQKPIYVYNKPTTLDVKKYYNISEFEFLEVDLDVMKRIIKNNEIDRRNSYKFKILNLFKIYKNYCISGLAFLFCLFIILLGSITAKEEELELLKIKAMDNIVEISKKDINALSDEQLIEFLNENIKTEGDIIEDVTFKDLSGKEHYEQYMAGAYIVEASVVDKYNNRAIEKFVVSVSDLDSDGDKIKDEDDENPDINDTMDSDEDGILDKNDKYPEKNDLEQAKEEGKKEATKELEASQPIVQATPQESAPIQEAPQENIEAYQSSAYYENCDAVRAANAAPIYLGDPGYSKDLDRDGDGVGCE